MHTSENRLHVITQLRNELMPLYSQLIADKKEEQCEFCAQWGKFFPLTQQKEGLMFVGIAMNSWTAYNQDTHLLFSELNDEHCIFNRPDQLEWLRVPKQEYGYKSSRSSFWNVICNTTKAWMPELSFENCYQAIVWSNLYKLAPMRRGNPQKKDNLDINRKILAKEIEIFSPKVVIAFVKMDWAIDFFEGLKDKTSLTEVWSDRNFEAKLFDMANDFFEGLKDNTAPRKVLHERDFEAKLFDMGSYHLIVTEHPNFKKAAPHVAALTRLIQSINF